MRLGASQRRGAECLSCDVLTNNIRGGTRVTTPNHRLRVTSGPIDRSSFLTVATALGAEDARVTFLSPPSIS